MEIKFVCSNCLAELGRLIKAVITQEDKDFYEASVGCANCQLETCTVEDVV